MGSRPLGFEPLPHVRLVGFCFLLVLAFAGGTSAATLVVPDDYSTIGAAIAASGSGDSVLVREGTYVEHLVIPHDLTLTSIALLSFPVIDGNHNLDSSVVRILPPARVRIDGFRITRGRGLLAGGIWAEVGTELWLEDCEINQNGRGCNDNGGTGGVAAALIHASRCLFSGNGSSGPYNDGVGALSMGAGEVRDCTFIGNYSGLKFLCAGQAGGVAAGSGLFERCRFEFNGGLVQAASLLVNGVAVIRDCEFVDHYLQAVGGEQSVVTLEGQAVIERCRFENTVNPGRVPIVAAANSVSITGSTFVDNSEGGVAVALYTGRSNISKCLFARSTMAAISAAYCELHITNSTFVDLQDYGAMLSMFGGSVSMHRSIIAGTRGGPVVQCKGAVGDFGCNDFWDNEYGHVGCPPGPTDFSADPRFCNRLGGDYSLLAGSPCAPPQSPPGCGLIGAFDVGCTPLEVPDVANTGLVPLRMAVDPHPILGRTTIRLDLADTMPVAIVLFDAQGRTLRRLLAGERTAGHHAVGWDGLDSRGQRAAPGIYFLRVEAGGTTVSRKLVVLDR